MNRIRFTLAQLMAVVLYFGFGFAALRNADAFWASATYTLAIIMITGALLGAFARTGRVHTPWTGFAAFGSSYVLMTQLPSWQLAAPGDGWIPRPDLLIEWGLAMLQPYINPMSVRGRNFNQYWQVSHSLGIILFGLVGAVLGRLMVVKDERPNA
jgi:hypothetical protein